MKEKETNPIVSVVLYYCAGQSSTTEAWIENSMALDPVAVDLDTFKSIEPGQIRVHHSGADCVE